MAVKTEKSIQDLQHDEWTDYTELRAGDVLTHIVRVACDDRHEDYGWYTAHLLTDRHVHLTSMSAGPIGPDEFESFLRTWIGLVVD